MKGLLTTLISMGGIALIGSTAVAQEVNSNRLATNAESAFPQEAQQQEENSTVPSPINILPELEREWNPGKHELRINRPQNKDCVVESFRREQDAGVRVVCSL